MPPPAFLIQHKFVPAAEMELRRALEGPRRRAGRTPPSTEFYCLYLLGPRRRRGWS
jgi:hypothetical protein